MSSKRTIRFFSTFMLALTALASSPAQADSAPDWKAGYKDGGGGIWWSSQDENLRVNLLGYAQINQKLFLSDSYRTMLEAPLGFSVRRARFDFGATFYKDHTLFVEFDGAPITSVTPGSPAAFAMVEAHTTHRLLEDQLSLRIGKFVVPFAAENFRSSRAYDTVERYMVLNSLFGLPALDTQYGAMLTGKLLAGNSLSWYVVVANGNAKATANTAETNTDKEYVARINYDLYNDAATREQLTLGLALDLDNESGQTLRLSDLTGASFNSVAVSGSRRGTVGDVFFMNGPLSVRAEYLDMQWADAPGSPAISGGFLQVGYFFNGGSEKGGLQALVRAELANLRGNLATPGAEQLTAGIIGWQWYLNANVRHQLNLIATSPNRAAPGVYQGAETILAALSSMQIKF